MQWVYMQLRKSQGTLFKLQVRQGFRLPKNTWLIGMSPNKWRWAHLDSYLDSSFKRQEEQQGPPQSTFGSTDLPTRPSSEGALTGAAGGHAFVHFS